MSNCWLISDMHFGHANIIKFTRDDGTWLRPFSSVEEMDEHMIDNWNRVVNAKDRVYMLGDVVIKRKSLHVLSRLNGRKVLIKGNHDIFPAEEYLGYVDDVRGYHVLDGMIMSHIPVHPDSLARFGCNIHGHLHYREVVLPGEKVDPRYFNVSVERINYTPISFEECKRIIKFRGGHVGFHEHGERAM
jgi:calcineurin-like phosphoesterase family protein